MAAITPILLLQVYTKEKESLLYKTGISIKTESGVVIRVGDTELNGDECLWTNLECNQLVADNRALANKEIVILMKHGITPKLCSGDLTNIVVTPDEITSVCAGCGTAQKIKIMAYLKEYSKKNV